MKYSLERKLHGAMCNKEEGFWDANRSGHCFVRFHVVLLAIGTDLLDAWIYEACIYLYLIILYSIKF